MARFKTGDYIGEGGFGTVHHSVRLDESGRVVERGLARKSLRDKHRKNAKHVARFKREARLLSDLDHPHIINIVGRNLSADPPWFVMPYAATDLRAELKTRGGDVAWAEEVFAQILDAMEYAHTYRSGVLHRDLKPDNVLFVSGVLKVSDFGLGKRLDENTVIVTMDDVALGTPRYRAPEQERDAATVGPPADVYALGRIFWALLTGKEPDDGPLDLDAVPDGHRDFIERCTEEDQTDRYASAADAKAAFEFLVVDEPGSLSGAALEDLLSRWEDVPVTDDHEIVEAIVDALLARSDEEELYYQIVPRLPRGMTVQFIDRHPDKFARIVEVYEGHTSGALPFDYCDVLAGYFGHVYEHTADDALKSLLLRRLIELGPSHNRFFVGRTTARILAKIGDPDEAKMAAKLLASDTFDARWLRPYAKSHSLDPAIEAVFASLDD